MEQLIIDMEDRFDSNEIISLGEYIFLLNYHKNRKAKVKLFSRHSMFEIAMTYKLIESS